jgi:hypothetical protein
VDILLRDVSKSNIQQKLEKAVKVVFKDNEKNLAKLIRDKQGYKTSEIPVQEQLEAKYLNEYSDIVSRLLSGLSRQLGLTLVKAEDDIFKIKGKVIYNPQTRKPLTVKEWKLIKKSIDKYLGTQTDDMAEKIALEQASLGNVLQRMEANGVRLVDIKLKQIEDSIYGNIKDYNKAYDWFEHELYPIENGMARLGNHITGINEDVRKDIITILNNGIVNGKTKQEISRDLLDSMANRNRDWERIVAYESQYHFNTGYLTSEVKHARKGEKIYMQAISQPDACKFCKNHLNGRIYLVTTDEALLGTKPKGDKYANGYTMVGATNIGRSTADYIAVIPLHPHCRCRWVRWYPEFAELEAL